MIIERTKNAARNIVFGSILKVLNIVAPFLMRSVLLNYLGVEYLGLNGLFKALLSFLNLAELGVGSAMVFSMYKPIAEDNTEEICALLRLYRTFYRVIGLFIAVAGLAVAPFLRKLISGDIPQGMNLYTLYFMHLGGTAFSYWLLAYRYSLLQAHQRTDVISKVCLGIQIVEYAMKCVVLMVFRNYYVYLSIQLISQIAINLLSAWAAMKMYPNYFPHGHLPKDKTMDIVCRVRDLFTSKFSSVIFTHADTLVISAFMGLAALAVYQNYFFIITALFTILDVIVSACIAGVGNSLVVEREEKIYSNLNKFTMLYGWIMGVSSAMLLCMYQPFMQIWMGEENLLAFNYVVCFVIYFYTMGMNKIINMFKDAAGIWRKDRWRPLVSALVNLGLNLATVRWLGLYGVLLSSVISIVLVQIPWLFHNLFQEVFPHKYLWKYVRLYLGLFVVAFVSCFISWFICSRVSLGVWPTLILSAATGFLIPNMIILPIYGRNPEFRDAVLQIKNVIMKKAKKA